jgi:hypothetical protein
MLDADRLPLRFAGRYRLKRGLGHGGKMKAAK